MANHKPINMVQLGDLKVDDDGRLYWKDKIVQTESVVVLSGGQTFLGWVIAIAAIVSAFANAYTALRGGR